MDRERVLKMEDRNRVCTRLGKFRMGWVALEGEDRIRLVLSKIATYVYESYVFFRSPKAKMFVWFYADVVFFSSITVCIAVSLFGLHSRVA